MAIMTPDEFGKYGRVLYGEHWQAELSIELDVSARTIRRWLSGDSFIPPNLEYELKQLCIKKHKQLAELLDEY